MERSTRTIARKRYRKCFFFIVLYFFIWADGDDRSFFRPPYFYSVKIQLIFLKINFLGVKKTIYLLTGKETFATPHKGY